MGYERRWTTAGNRRLRPHRLRDRPRNRPRDRPRERPRSRPRARRGRTPHRGRLPGQRFLLHHRTRRAPGPDLRAQGRSGSFLPAAGGAQVAHIDGPGRAGLARLLPPWAASSPPSKPDLKEGLYFGAELEPDDPRPLHGPNLFPEEVPELGPAVLAYMDALTHVGQAVMRGVALSLGLDEDYFAAGYTATPTTLFRIFHYPSPPYADPEEWGVGEHTDYGLLTLLLQDDNPGLQVHTSRGWIEAPPIPGTLVCNIGDMLDKLTGGLYRSTPHRVRNATGRVSSPSRSSSTRAGTARCRRCPRCPPARGPPPMGRPGPAGLHRHVRRLPDREGRQGVPGTRLQGAAAVLWST